MILVVDATSKPTGHGGIINNNPDCKCRTVTGGEADEQLFEQCDSCRELDEREALEEWPDIPVLQPITTQVRRFSPETLAEFGLTERGEE